MRHGVVRRLRLAHLLRDAVARAVHDSRLHKRAVLARQMVLLLQRLEPPRGALRPVRHQVLVAHNLHVRRPGHHVDRVHQLRRPQRHHIVEHGAGQGMRLVHGARLAVVDARRGPYVARHYLAQLEAVLVGALRLPARQLVVRVPKEPVRRGPTWCC
jgi:hypothetical protein